MKFSSPVNTTKPLSHRQAYTLVGAFSLGSLLFFPGSQAINPLLPSVRAEFGLSGAQMGLITSLFILPYLLMQIPGGVLADRIGAKRTLVGMLLVAGTCLTAIGL